MSPGRGGGRGVTDLGSIGMFKSRTDENWFYLPGPPPLRIPSSPLKAPSHPWTNASLNWMTANGTRRSLPVRQPWNRPPDPAGGSLRHCRPDLVIVLLCGDLRAASRQKAIPRVMEGGREGERSCRIENFRTLPARLFVALAFAVVFSLVMIFAAQTPWIWMALTVLPLVGGRLDDERQAQEGGAGRRD